MSSCRFAEVVRPQQLDFFNRSDYLNKDDSRGNGTWIYTLKNPDSRNLSFNDLINETTRLGDESLDRNHIFSSYGDYVLNEFVWRNVSVPVFGLVTVGTTLINLTNMIDFNRTHISYDAMGQQFSSKDEWISINFQTGQVEQNITEEIMIGRRVELQKIPLDVGFRIRPGQEVLFQREIIPTMNKLPGGGWGWSIFQDWWNVSFINRINITFNNTDQDENLTGFSVLVVLNSSIVDYDSIQNSGQDIRFTDEDESTILPHEIELWNESGDSFIWVRVPQINASSAVDYIQMYFNDSTVSDGQDSDGTWDGNYQGVWHMNNDPTGTDPALIDSSGNGVHGSMQGSMTATDLEPALIDGGIDFDSVNDVFNMSDNIPLINDSLPFTIESWITVDDYSGELYPTYGFFQTVNGGDEPFVMFASSTTNYQGFLFGTVNGARGETNTFATELTQSFVQAVIVYNGNGLATLGNFQVYLNGTLQTLTTPGAFLNTDNLNRIGSDETLANPFDGTVDEIRISWTNRTGYWVNATFLSESNNYNVFSAVETFDAADSTAPVISNITNSSINATRAVIQWQCDEACNGTVNYGADTNLGNETFNTTFQIDTIVNLIGLPVNSQIFYNVTACDSSGNCQTNGTFNFSTNTVLIECANLLPGGANVSYTLASDIVDYGNGGGCFNVSSPTPRQFNISLDCQGNKIDGQRINGQYGIHGISLDNSTIKNCEISDFQYDIYFNDGDYNLIVNNTLWNAEVGLLWQNGRLSNITGNRMNGTSDSLHRGIWFTTSGEDNNVSYNNITANFSIVLNFADGNNFWNNRFRAFDEVINISNFMTLSLFYNNIINGSNHASSSGGNHLFNTTIQTGDNIIDSSNSNIGGNYWTNSTGDGFSDTCTDADTDGFCDSQYNINTGITDFLPLSNQFSDVDTCSPDGLGDHVFNCDDNCPVITSDVDFGGNDLSYTGTGTDQRIVIEASYTNIGRHTPDPGVCIPRIQAGGFIGVNT